MVLTPRWLSIAAIYAGLSGRLGVEKTARHAVVTARADGQIVIVLERAERALPVAHLAPLTLVVGHLVAVQCLLLVKAQPTAHLELGFIGLDRRVGIYRFHVFTGELRLVIHLSRPLC